MGKEEMGGEALLTKAFRRASQMSPNDLSQRDGAADSELMQSASERSRRNITIIFNPTAGGARRRRLSKVIARLESRGANISLRPTTQAGDAERFATEYRLAGQGAETPDLIVAAGGDGTINEVVNGLAVRDVPRLARA